MRPGWCGSKAHDRHHLGLGGRRVLVSRQWTGKTLTEHKADRAEVVRQTLAAAGVEMPDSDRFSAAAADDDGQPRFIWTAVDPRADDDLPTWHGLMTRALVERIRWRTEYEQAKRAGPGADHTSSATDKDPADTAA
jgi:hypothetical protein